MSLLLLLTLAGCWDYHPITSRVFVLGMAVDLAPEGGYLISLQVPAPAKLKPSGGGAPGGASGAAPGAEFSLHYGVGPTFIDALEAIQSHMDRVFFFGHMRTVIFGEDVAAAGLSPLMEELVRYPQIDKLAWGMVARGAPAREFLTLPCSQEGLSSLFLSKTFDNARVQDMTVPVNLSQFYIRAWEPGYFEGLPTIEISPDAFAPGQSSPVAIGARGFALFDDWKMVGWLSPEETRSLRFLRGTAEHVSFSLPDGGEGRFDEVRQMSAQTLIKVSLDANGAPRFEISVKVAGNLAGTAEQKIKLESGDVERIQQETASFLQARLAETVEHLKESGSDVLGLGSRLFYRFPKTWDAIDWGSYYRTVPVTIKVKVKLLRTGLTT